MTEQQHDAAAHRRAISDLMALLHAADLGEHLPPETAAGTITHGEIRTIRREYRELLAEVERLTRERDQARQQLGDLWLDVGEDREIYLTTTGNRDISTHRTPVRLTDLLDAARADATAQPQHAQGPAQPRHQPHASPNTTPDPEQPPNAPQDPA